MVIKNSFSKKLIASFSILLIGSAISGCGDNSNDSSSGDETSSVDFQYLIPGRFARWLDELNWYDEVIERTGVEVDIQSGPDEDADYYASVDQRLISDDFPDSGIVTVSQAVVYSNQGAFLDLTSYIDEYAPNIKRYIEENSDFEQLITNEEGQIFYLVAEAPVFADFVFYRQDHFDKAGVTEIPDTIEEFTEALRTLKEYYGEENSSYYPLTGREGYIRWQNFFNADANYDDGVSRGIYGNGKTGTDIYSDGYLEMVTWLKELNDEGLIDPEWISGSTTEETWQTKMLTGQASISYDYYTRPSWFVDNGGPDNDPDYDISILPWLEDLNGQTAVQNAETRYNINRAFVVNPNSEDKIQDILEYIDFFYTEEGQTLVSYGVEGESYEGEVDEEEFIVEFSEEENKEDGEKRWSFLNDRLTFPKPLDNEAFYKWNTDLVAEAATLLFTEEYLNPGTIVKYSAEEAESLSNLSATVNEAVNAGVTEFVTGSRDLNEWLDFLEEMESLGYKDIVEIQQNAYDAMYE